MKPSKILTLTATASAAAGIVHPGLLHTDDDFNRIREYVESGDEPWATGWQKLLAHTDADYTPSPNPVVCRGSVEWCDQNYPTFYRDVHAAYANAVRWRISGDASYADAAARILDAWSSTLEAVDGNADKWLAAGIYGYQLANAAEVLRDFNGWKGLDATVDMLVNIFYPMNHHFLTVHNGAPLDNYWANWDLCTLAGMHAIGVLADRQDLIDEAIDYFKNGGGMGAIENTIWKIHNEEDTNKALGQNQEAGRDQGHATLVFAHLAVLAQQSYSQGEDLFAYLDSRILAGAEYIFKYNTGNDVPFSEYTNRHGTATQISESGRGSLRPIAELLFAHYNGIKGLNASWTGEYRDLVVEAGDGAEGGGGDYGSNSGGYDQLGFGTLLFRLRD